MNKMMKNDIEVNYTLEPFEIVSVKKGGVETVYQMDSTWQKAWPILFPLCGSINDKLTHEGFELNVERHGFFRRIKGWETVLQKDDFVELKYVSNGDFASDYPFEFEIRIELSINDNSFSINLIVKNIDSKDMYYSIGHHPGFVFDKSSKLSLDEETDFTDQFDKGVIVNYEKNIVIKEFGFDNLDFSNGKSYMTNDFDQKDVTIENQNIKYKIKNKNLKDMVLWRENNDCSFVCVENWSGVPDMVEKKSTELKDKPAIIKLEPNKSQDFLLTLEF